MKRIQELRKKKGLSGEKLGEIVGVQKSAISKYERGEIQPSNEVLLMIANTLNTSTDYLLENTDNPTPPNAKEKTMLDLHGLDPENDRAYFSVMATLKEQGLLPHDLQVIAETYKAAKERDKEMKG